MQSYKLFNEFQTQKNLNVSEICDIVQAKI